MAAGAASVTTTSVVAVASSKWRSLRTVRYASTGKERVSMERKPLASAAILYWPGETSGNDQAPAAFEAVARLTPVASLVRTTFAPGTAAPAGSVARPVTVPSGVWARNTDTETKKIIGANLIRKSPLCHTAAGRRR